MRTLLIILSATTLVGCASGGGSSLGPVAPATSATQETPATAAKSRHLPGVEVSLAAGASPGRWHLKADALTTVTAFAGHDYDAARPIAAQSDGAGGWWLNLDPAAGLLVRVELPDGAVVETAPGDLLP